MGGVQQQIVVLGPCRYLPRTYALLNATTIKIISARSMFGQEFPGDFARWKIEAFKSILNTTDTNVLLPPRSW